MNSFIAACVTSCRDRVELRGEEGKEVEPVDNEVEKAENVENPGEGSGVNVFILLPVFIIVV